jgi:hypothetical protein
VSVRSGRQPRPQLQVHLGQQVHRHDGGRAEVGGEQVLRAELGPVGHARGARGGAAALHQLRHDLHAQAARTEAAGRRDDDAAVARAEVDHVIRRADARQLQHRHRDVVRRGDEGHLVELRGRRLGGARGCRREARGEH